MIAGRATAEGTAAFSQRNTGIAASSWRNALGLTLSSIGLGTYLGNPDDRDDARYSEAAIRATERGINVIDSAINYRFQRSERSIGTAITSAIQNGKISRKELLVCSKGGFLSGDGDQPSRAWFERTFITPGIATADDIVGGCHCMTPKYLRHELEQSRKNLGLETIDVYYVHNPETQIPEVGADEFYRRLTEAFRTLEACVQEGSIGVYGTATWNGYRVPPEDPSHLSLERVLDSARSAGGESHHFRVIQFPFNTAMTEALTQPTQSWHGRRVPLLEATQEAGLTVFTSGPLLQGRLLRPGAKAELLLQIARSTPGITAPLCGMKNTAHVDSNTSILREAPLPAEMLRKMIP